MGSNREEINRKAENHANASVYSLNNEFLDEQEKFEVELWFQLPGNLLLLALLSCAVGYLLNQFTWKALLGIPLAVNIVAGLVNWHAYRREVVRVLSLTVCNNWFLWSVTLVVMALLAYSGLYLLAFVVLLAKMGLCVLFEVHVLIYSILALRYKMHPKYAFFKRNYGYVFPFEEQ